MSIDKTHFKIFSPISGCCENSAQAWLQSDSVDWTVPTQTGQALMRAPAIAGNGVF